LSQQIGVRVFRLLEAMGWKEGVLFAIEYVERIYVVWQMMRMSPRKHLVGRNR